MRMIERAAAGMALLTLAGSLFSQSPPTSPAAAPSGPPPSFTIADVHSSEHSNTPTTRGGMLKGDRYTLRQATMTNLIARAYSLGDSYVLGGPAWLDLDRFDIVAQAPRGTSSDEVRLMIRSLLVERFKLVTHPDTKPLPAYALTVGKGGPS